MKNGLLYSFLACLLVTPTQAYAADPPSVNVYGRIHFRLIEQNDKNTNLINAGHRIGLRGEGKLDNGYDFFYTLETEYKNDSGFGKNDGIGGKDVTNNSSRSSTDLADIVVRHANAGLKTKLGSLTIGRQNNPLNATYVADVFEFNSGVGEQSPYRIGNAIVYKAKSIAGVKGYAGAMLEGGDGTSTEEQKLTGAVFGGAYSIAGININAGYFLADYSREVPDDITTVGVDESIDTKTEFTDWSVGVSYSMGEMYFGVNIESSTSDKDGTETDTDVIDLAATYTMKSVTYGVGYASVDDGTDTGTRILLGAYVNLGGNSDCYFETGQYNEEAGDGDNYVFGYRVKF